MSRTSSNSSPAGSSRQSEPLLPPSTDDPRRTTVSATSAGVSARESAAVTAYKLTKRSRVRSTTDASVAAGRASAPVSRASTGPTVFRPPRLPTLPAGPLYPACPSSNCDHLRAKTGGVGRTGRRRCSLEEPTRPHERARDAEEQQHDGEAEHRGR